MNEVRGMSASWNLGLIDSAWAGSPWEGRAGLEKTKEIGFDTADIFVGYDPGELSAGERQTLLRDLTDVGLPIPSVVCTALGLSDFNGGVRRYHIERAKRIIDLAQDIGTVSNILFVPGEYVFQRQLIPPQREWDLVVDATREVATYAGERGLELAVELLPFDFGFIRTVDDLLRLIEAVGLENVKASIDISHLWLLRIDPSEISRLGASRLSHVHLADCDGVQHGDLPIGRGNTPFPAYLEALRDNGFAGTASVELEFPPDPARMVEWVTEAFDSAQLLLREAGVRE
jgi:sugar phosphate isomerase/epimerase